jgi:hypothetical protein
MRGAIPPLPQFVFMARCLVKHRDNFTFTFTFTSIRILLSVTNDEWRYAGILLRRCIQNFLDWVDNEIYAYNNKHSLRNNTKGYGGKTNQIDSKNSDTAAPSGRELHHLQFSLQLASPEILVILSYLYTYTKCVVEAAFKSATFIQNFINLSKDQRFQKHTHVYRRFPSCNAVFFYQNIFKRLTLLM